MDKEGNQEGKYAVETMALTKTFKGKAAVKNLDMKVREGAIYGFIGRNGAGKSTTLKMSAGLRPPPREISGSTEKLWTIPAQPGAWGALLSPPVCTPECRPGRI